MTYFTARSNLVLYAFVWEKGKTVNFSEIIVIYDIKAGRCSQLIEYMNLYDFKSQRHASTFSSFFSLETAWVIEAKFDVEPSNGLVVQAVL